MPETLPAGHDPDKGGTESQSLRSGQPAAVGWPSIAGATGIYWSGGPAPKPLAPAQPKA
jgi:hypothetical protein